MKFQVIEVIWKFINQISSGTPSGASTGQIWYDSAADRFRWQKSATVVDLENIDPTTIVGITGTMAQFNTAVTDWDFVDTVNDQSIAGTKTFSGLIEYAAALWKKISFYWTNYFIGIQNSLLQIGSENSWTRVGIGYWTTWAFTETFTVKGWNVWIWTTSPANKFHIIHPDWAMTASLITRWVLEEFYWNSLYWGKWWVATIARWTKAAPTSVAATDTHNGQTPLFYDGTKFRLGGFMETKVSWVVANTSVTTDLLFHTWVVSWDASLWQATGLTEQMRILASWYVWIWTSNPLAKFQVESSTASAARIRATETWDTTDAHYAWFEFFEWTTFRGGIFKNGLSQDVSLWTGSQRVTILASNWNVGIANTAPSEKLDVTGNIKSSWTVEAANTSWFEMWTSATMKFNTVSSSIDFIIN
jgi:hypothetical protein